MAAYGFVVREREHTWQQKDYSARRSQALSFESSTNIFLKQFKVDTIISITANNQYKVYMDMSITTIDKYKVYMDIITKTINQYRNYMTLLPQLSTNTEITWT